jgi:hypothetical protein
VNFDQLMEEVSKRADERQPAFVGELLDALLKAKVKQLNKIVGQSHQLGRARDFGSQKWSNPHKEYMATLEEYVTVKRQIAWQSKRATTRIAKPEELVVAEGRLQELSDKLVKLIGERLYPRRPKMSDFPEPLWRGGL